jgi:DNA-binding TFAR19-related protein (PDSD5 family)
MEQEEIKQKRINELKEKYAQQAEEQQRRTELENQIDSAMKLVLDENARTRLYNVRLVNKELYFKTAQSLIYLYKTGKVQEKIGETQLKKLLEQLSEKREINITRK